MQYNIRTGFRKTQRPYELDGDRIVHAIKAVKRENPDILILNEAYFERKNSSGILMDYKKIFDFPFYAHGNYKNGLSPFWGHALLSKYPIKILLNKGTGFAGLFRNEVKIGEKIINLDVVHIAPVPFLDGNGQESFVKRVLSNKKENYILVGDFNSLSPKDKYNKKKLVASWSKFEINAELILSEMLKKDAIKSILSSGLVDSFKLKNKKFDFTIPTDFLSKDKSSGIRIDYIFCSKDIRVINSGIIKNALTEKASDHYPTYAIVDF